MYAFVYKMMSRLIAKGIIRSHSMRQRRIAAAVKSPNGIIFNCDVCGLMFNAQRYMHENDAYFAPSMTRFPYELKKIFIGSYTNCNTMIKCIHITLHWIWTSWIVYV